MSRYRQQPTRSVAIHHSLKVASPRRAAPTRSADEALLRAALGLPAAIEDAGDEPPPPPTEEEP